MNYGLPQGISLAYAVGVLLSIGAVTVLLRWLPFRLLGVLRGSGFLAMLSGSMPAGVMLILVVFTASTVTWQFVGAVVVTIILHFWKKSAVLSIVIGTVVYSASLQF